MPTRSEAGGGELPGEAQARRPQRRAGLRGRELARSRSLQPGAASPAAAAASSRRKPEDGGAAQRRPGKEAVSPDPAGSSEESEAPGGACAAHRARGRILGDCAERLRSREEAPPAAAAAAAPECAEEGAGQ
ncbi:hypothetical protein JEQ12_001311 [Ovis aries]|uniref:Uncharacterized protein n=1 Tax=Ovis aries TaxID=9940 RepID=A0A836D8N7_SHEEP|nr:hypothetical protein JEQ12_001311 [Ovis aries]